LNQQERATRKICSYCDEPAVDVLLGLFCQRHADRALGNDRRGDVLDLKGENVSELPTDRLMLISTYMVNVVAFAMSRLPGADSGDGMRFVNGAVTVSHELMRRGIGIDGGSHDGPKMMAMAEGGRL